MGKRKVVVEAIVRDPSVHLRETKQDINKMKRNYSKDLHPMQAQREYTKALNAAKLEKVFSKPYVTTLDGHNDSVMRLSLVPHNAGLLLSYSANCELKLWDVSRSRNLFSVYDAHGEFNVLKGMAVRRGEGNFSALVTCAVNDDKVKLWRVDNNEITHIKNVVVCEEYNKKNDKDDFKSTVVDVNFNADCSRLVVAKEDELLFLDSSSDNYQVLSKIKNENYINTRAFFNPVERSVLLGLTNENTAILYDTRENSKVSSATLSMRSNAASWNPMEPIYFVLANEDSNCYLFDIRKLGQSGAQPLKTFRDNLNAVLDVDFSPSGLEFASGCYDRSLRIFPVANQAGGIKCDGRSRDVYHTQRMQRLFAVRYSADGKYIYCGSDEMNIRVWKSCAWEKLGWVSFFFEKLAAAEGEEKYEVPGAAEGAVRALSGGGQDQEQEAPAEAPAEREAHQGHVRGGAEEEEPEAGAVPEGDGAGAGGGGGDQQGRALPVGGGVGCTFF